MPQSLQVIAIIKVQPPHLETVHEALRTAQLLVLEEDDCEHDAFYADTAMPTRLFVIER